MRESMRTVRGVSALAAVVVAVFLAPGCEKPSAKSGSNEGSSGSTAPVEVRLGYFANLSHAQAVLGVASGEFQEAIGPNTLKTHVFNAGPSLIEALFAGEVDIGYIGPGPALSGFEKSRGEGLRVIAGAATNGVVIVARKDSGINSLADLAGKKLATPQIGNTQDIAARHYLINELKQPNADNVVPIANAEQLAMMSRGEIDAAWAPEPWGARLIAEAGAKLIAEEKDLWPDKQFMLTVVIVRPEFLQAHPEIVEKFLHAHVALTERFQKGAMDELPKLGEALYALTQKRLEQSTLQQAMSRIGFSVQPHEETFKKMSEWSLELGYSRNRPDLSKMIDTTILERVKNGQPGGGA